MGSSASTSPTDVRLLAWNIRQGGGSRLVGIMAALARHDADVLILSEYRGGDSSDRLRAALRVAGFRHVTELVPPLVMDRMKKKGTRS